jgi:hypothetical protein
MSKDRTLVTELVTALGMIPTWTLETLETNAPAPKELVGVEDTEWESLLKLWRENEMPDAFFESFASGRYFLTSNQGLRDRPPQLVEWKGKHQSPEHDPLPVDIRIDHVFAVSCKNYSKILLNPSPNSLFRHALTEGGVTGLDWFNESAPHEYYDLLKETFAFLDLGEAPGSVAALSQEQRLALKNAFRNWPHELEPAVQRFVAAVSHKSADALNSALPSIRERERFFWRIMRIHSAPYFMLGNQRSGSLHLRVLTPWDFRRKYEFRGLEILPEARGQAQVRWRASVFDNELGSDMETEGHIEIRWSHGRFNKAPEGKIYLDTPHHLAAGYVQI